ncbi:MAG TPA: sodium:solute symporter [Saprospiraceae bacterium]|nr:sodium:solute symporter [Saprospiraceae bacterium]
MEKEQWFWSTIGLLALYAGVILFLVVRGARRTKSLSDYAVGSKGFSPVVVGLSLAASITSAATFIINPGFIAMYGLSAFLAFAVVLPLGLGISLVLLTRSFRRYGTSVKALTISQWIGQRYQSKQFALFFAILSLLLITFIVLICVGMTKVLSQALGAEEWIVLSGIVVFVFGYMMFGGANSMIYTNTIQALTKLLVAFILLGSGLEHFSAGIDGFWDSLAQIDPNLTMVTNPSSPISRDFFEIFVCNFIVGIAIVCQPHIITKSLMLRSDQDVRKYLVVGLTTVTIFFFVVITGFYARFMFPDLQANGQPIRLDGIVSAYVVRRFTLGIGLIVVIGLVSSGLATLEGLIQSISTNITSDLIRPLFGRFFSSDRQYVLVNRMVIIVLAGVAFLLSINQLRHPNLSVGIFAQNGVYAYFSAAFVPVLFGIFLKKTPTIAVVGASITAILVHFGTYYGGVTEYLQGPVRNPAVAATYAILASVSVGLLLYVSFKKLEV